MTQQQVICIDNGAGSCKVGWAGQPCPTKVFPNCTAKAKGEKHALVGDMVADTKDVMQLALRRPFDRGYLVNWDLEREIWTRCFKAVLKARPQDCGLLMTEPVFNFAAIQSTTEQVVFEEFGFQSFYAAPAPFFSLRRHTALHPDLPAAQAGCGVVLDVGASFTHVVPFFDNQILEAGIKRINMGGKALTNYLKELVSYRSLNMMEETYLMEQIKEQLCFVSQDLRADLKLAAMGNKSQHRLEYVLADGVNVREGYVRNSQQKAAQYAALASDDERRKLAMQEQVLVLNNERFLVPEVIFHPTDIGLNQAGVAETIVQSVSSTHAALHPLLYTNVLVTGGMVRCPGFTSRLKRELRPLVPSEYKLNVYEPTDPVLCAWEGMSEFGASADFPQVAMTRAEYEETGGSSQRQHR